MKIIIFFLSVLLCLFPRCAAAFFIIADVSPNRVEIHSKFTGKTILVFGAIMEKADNLIVIIHGPIKDIAVHKKIKLFGVWLNGPKSLIKAVPLFFSFSSADGTYKDLDKVFHGEFTPFPHISNLTEEVAAFTDSRARNALYQFDNKLEIINGTLFRGNISLPASIPRGQYIVEFIALNENRIIGIEAMPLFVVKTGLDARISELSHSHTWFYALVAISGTLFIGWFGFAVPRVFRRLLTGKNPRQLK